MLGSLGVLLFASGDQSGDLFASGTRDGQFLVLSLCVQHPMGTCSRYMLLSHGGIHK